MTLCLFGSRATMAEDEQSCCQGAGAHTALQRLTRAWRGREGRPSQERRKPAGATGTVGSTRTEKGTDPSLRSPGRPLLSGRGPSGQRRHHVPADDRGPVRHGVHLVRGRRLDARDGLQLQPRHGRDGRRGAPAAAPALRLRLLGSRPDRVPARARGLQIRLRRRVFLTHWSHAHDSVRSQGGGCAQELHVHHGLVLCVDLHGGHHLHGPHPPLDAAEYGILAVQ